MRRLLWVLAAVSCSLLAGCACVGNLASSVHSTLHSLKHPFSAGACCAPGAPAGVPGEPAPFSPPEVYEGDSGQSNAPAPLPVQ